LNNDINQTAAQLASYHPFNTYPISVGLIALGYAAIESSIFATVVGGISIMVGLGSLVVNKYIRTEFFIEQALIKQHEDQAQAIDVRIQGINDSLVQYHRVDACRQMDTVLTKVQTFNEILHERFTGQGLAYSRFLGISDSIFSNVLNSYDEMILLLKQAASINEDRCIAAIGEIHQNVDRTTDVGLLNARLELKNVIIPSRIDDMLISNEQAITKLDVTMSSFADISTEKELEWAMNELQTLSTALSPNQNGEFA